MSMASFSTLTLRFFDGVSSSTVLVSSWTVRLFSFLWRRAFRTARHRNIEIPLTQISFIRCHIKLGSLECLWLDKRLVFRALCFEYSFMNSLVNRNDESILSLNKKGGAWFHALTTNEARGETRTSTTGGAWGGARARSRASNGQAWETT